MNDRYSRQILFQPISRSGQEALLQSRVALIGAGALGAAHAEILARAGVGFLRIIDRDFVEFSNLQRQTLYSEADAQARLPKAVAAKNRLAAVNSEINVEAIVADVNLSNVESLVRDVDLVLDGTDNFQIRYLLNDACVKIEKPWIYGAAVAAYGTTMTIIPNKTPCLRCIFEEMPDAGSSPTCDTAGVIQPIITSISAIQTTEAIKILTRNFDQLHKSLIQVDLWANDWRKIKISRPNPECKCCTEKHFEFLESENSQNFTTLCGRDAVQISAPKPTKLDLKKLAARLEKLTTVKSNEYLVRFSIEGMEITVFQDARAIIKGSDDLAIAKSLYAKYIGF